MVKLSNKGLDSLWILGSCNVLKCHSSFWLIGIWETSPSQAIEPRGDNGTPC